MFDVDGCIEVAVVVCSTLRTRPFPVLQCQFSVDISTMAASLGRWRKAVNFDIVLPSETALVFQLAVERTDGCICQIVGKMFVLHHPLHIQVFHTDGRRLVLAGEVVRDFVNVVVATVFDVLVQSGDALLQPSELAAANFLLRESA